MATNRKNALIRAHKIRLYPTKTQEQYFLKACGTARFAYNWAIDQAQKHYASGEQWSCYSLVKELNSIKHEQYPWMQEVTKQASQYAIHDACNAYQRFFKKHAKYPRYKKRGLKDSFAIREGKIRIDGNKIYIPRLGAVKGAEHLRFVGTVKQLTIKRQADLWFAVAVVELDNVRTMPNARAKSVGIDVGVREFVTSNNERYLVPRSYKASQKKVRRLQQSLFRKQKGSANRQKAKQKLARANIRVANQRNWWLHNTTTQLVKQYQTICIEDLNTKGMVKNHNLATSIVDAGFGEFKRQLEYKCAEYGRELVVIDRFYPSSKTCSVCGTKIDRLPLSKREWTCPSCNTHHDRDLNAAININNYAVNFTVSACGEFLPLAGVNLSSASESTSVKQEATLTQDNCVILRR